MTDEYINKKLTCVDCGKSFIWTAGEQRYFASVNLVEPKRDKECAKIRREAIKKENG